MAIPNLIEGIHRRTLVTQLKNIYGTVQELAREQLATRNTKNLLDTDFGDPAKLLTDKNFQITKKCTSGAQCWNAQYKRLSDKAVTTRPTSENIDTGKSIILKNGIIPPIIINITSNRSFTGNAIFNINNTIPPMMPKIRANTIAAP